MTARRVVVLLATLAFAAACDKPKDPAEAPTPDDQPPATAEPQIDPAAEPGPTDFRRLNAGRNPDGATLSYTRSNQDGTKPERVLVHIVSGTELHVAKMVERCTDAAYVTAKFDTDTGEASQLVGGRLKRDGTQEPQAWLDFDKATRKITVRLGDPKSKPSQTLAAPPGPWRMYDFDLAEFALFGPHSEYATLLDGREPGARTREANNFTFGLALAWPDGPPPLVKPLGKANAELIVNSDNVENEKTRLLDSVALYAVSGPAFGADGGGTLKLESRRGHVIEAQFSRPNHPGYEDFQLTLDALDEETGPKVWQDALAAHWKDCPA